MISLFFTLLVPFAARAQDTLYITTVVHIISDDPSSVSDAFIEQAIQDLNDGFSNSGRYAGATGADVKIRFRLARVAPDGGVTSGITRTRSIFREMDAVLEDRRLKDLINWDSERYFNVWYVNRINGEVMAEFSCGTWKRMPYGGYATMPPMAGSLDGAVVSSFGSVLIHEAGHYLGLKHTFEGGCINNDCSVDGDGICDTPPQIQVLNNCIPVNSCSTDTLSGFTTDQPDMIENFMGYSPCSRMFTKGQADKMREMLMLHRAKLTDTLAQVPCGPMPTADFVRDNWFPVAGSAVTFTAAVKIGVDYAWSIDGSPAGTNSASLTHIFPKSGKFTITLKVSSGGTCFSSYTHNVLVNCGVVSRFFANKKLIASRIPRYPDSILFSNQSFGAVDFQWLMSNDTGMAEQVISRDKDFKYVFPNPGRYFIRLVASTGSCIDTSEIYTVIVEDPIRDAYVGALSVECFQETKAKVSVVICNGGYEPVPKDLLLSFYDRDPQLAGAIKLGNTVAYPHEVLGRCCGPATTFIVDVGRRQLDTLFVAINDNGNKIPLLLPNTSVDEKYYFNNITRFTGFRHRATALPRLTAGAPGDTVLFRASTRPSPNSTYQWLSMPGLLCTSCKDAEYVVGKKDTSLQVVATSVNGCIDTASVNVRVVNSDDYTIRMQSAECYKQDSIILTYEVCNINVRKRLLGGLTISVFSGSPLRNGKRIGSALISNTVPVACSTLAIIVPRRSSDSLFMVVNDVSSTSYIPPSEAGLLEVDYTNNTDSLLYIPEPPIGITPSDTTVFYGQTFPLFMNGVLPPTSAILWSADGRTRFSCTDCTSPQATIRGVDSIRLTVTSRYGCTRKGVSSIKTFPPDLTILMLDAECIADTLTRVSFRICMNNGFDTLAHNIPVSFYSSDPRFSLTRPMAPVFYTGPARNLSCDTFSVVLPLQKGIIFGVVNDLSGVPAPGRGVTETNYQNNVHSITTDRFRIELQPNDTLVLRGSRIRVRLEEWNDKAAQYKWTPAQQVLCQNCPEPVVNVPYTLRVSLTATNRFGCASTDSIYIRSVNEDTIRLPNAFTPNFDGRNDVFYVIASGEVESVPDFMIYNRYGESVFRRREIAPNDPVYGWDGYTTDGRPAQMGVYVYQVQLRFRDGSLKWYKGTITLIR